MQTIPKNG